MAENILKIILRDFLKAILPSQQPPILVASMGRSGSTLVYDSIVKGMVKKRFFLQAPSLGGLVRDVIWKLSGAHFQNGLVYKTHDLPASLKVGDRPIVIFLFGSASDAARSVLQCENTQGYEWIKSHLKHLSAIGTLDDLPFKDVLRFSEQLDEWLSCQAVPILALRYEDLWTSDAEEKLSHFVGFSVRLPERRARESIGIDLGKKGIEIQSTYAALDAYVAQLPPIYTNDKANIRLQIAKVPNSKKEGLSCSY